jgi:misacylated tRNA(Ala) deacylase
MDALYLKDCYLKEFDAQVTSAKGKYIVLDQTAFYPNSGGQPWDEGVMIRDSDGKVFRVVFVGKFEGSLSHELDSEGLRTGDSVHCKINWDRRYKLMRYHTAAHIVSKVIREATGAKITGNQLATDKGRIDFDVEQFDKEALSKYEAKVNDIIRKDLEVRKYFLPKAEAFKMEELFSLKNVLPPEVEELRIVEIVGFDKSACGGTHLNRTSEIGKIKFTEVSNKGKNNRRVYFTLS